MSKRAEQRGLEALPPRWRKTKDGKGMIDSVLPVRKFYIRAYEQAEKDLALTWEDIRTICLLTIGAEIVRDKPDLADNVQEKLEQVFYEDVLRRFREMKNK